MAPQMFEQKKLVDGDGWISDESSFCGGDETKERYENESRWRDLCEIPQMKYAERVVTNVAAKARAEMPVKKEIKGKGHEGGTASTTAEGSSDSWKSSHLSSSSTPKLHNRMEGNMSARQLNETVAEFTKRLSVSSRIEDVGPWIWITNPHNASMGDRSDEPKLMEEGERLLESFSIDRASIESENVGKAQTNISRKVTPLREKLKDDLDSLARETHVLNGKWMLFPKDEDLARTWRLVAEGVADNRLGDTAKVATIAPDTRLDDGRLICVYTKDYTDMKDVRRVLDELVDLNLIKTNDNRGIYYKTDAYTHLDLNSKNEYGLRASMYSSRELLTPKSPQKRPAAQSSQPRKKQMTLTGFYR